MDVGVGGEKTFDCGDLPRARSRAFPLRDLLLHNEDHGVLIDV